MKNQSSTFITSTSFNPWFNLSLEEYLFGHVNRDEIILYLWQNKDTVVIGRNQNPWKECDIEKIRNDDIKLARRLSGGGTVYHDIGNLNFTFIMRKELYDLEKQLNVILKAVNSFGLNAKFSGRNDILLDGRKFSGNAYYFGDEASYHHGTILINSNISKLSQYLKPSKGKIISKGIDSIKSRVVNLNSVNSEINVEKMKLSILKCFQQCYGKVSKHLQFNENIISDNTLDNTLEITLGDTLDNTFPSLYAQYSSWEWIYGECPSFDVYYENRFSWGEIQIGLNFEDGYISNCKIYTDALYTSFVNKIEDSLLRIKYNKDRINETIISINPQDKEEQQMYEDILQMF
ncbi:MAG: lipoate--protein ligase [Clostridia bacterium]|nr:lipoate--protein ligase [Clostridia bacterium]